MKKIVITAIIASIFSMSVYANEEECKKLKHDHDVIYAAKGFCFKDEEAKRKFGNENCYTSNPKFSDKEQQRLDNIKARQKELSCKL